MGSQTTSPDPGTAKAPETILIEKTYKYFDFDTFEEKEEKVSVSFTPASDYAEAVNRVNNDSTVILTALNAYLQRAALRESRQDVAKKGANKKIVLDVIRSMRNLSPWDEIEPRAEQTKALLAMVRSNPVLVESIKKTSLKAAESDTDTDDTPTEE